MFDKKILQEIMRAQKNEITECFIYRNLSTRVRDQNNAAVLKKIADEELNHYHFWEKLSGIKILPSKYKIVFYTFLAKIFGLSFSLQLMERGEKFSQETYERLKNINPAISRIIQEECAHEQELLKMITEKKVQYAPSIILGLNDALVELTGALSGLTLALQDSRIIGIVGFITGTAASFSMAGSEYLSIKEEGGKNPLQAAIFTGISYIFTVFFLVLPYFIFSQPFVCLAITIITAIFIIFFFTYYTSIVKGVSFKKKFFEMAIISLGVATISFLIGFFIKKIFDIEVK